jgi:hypothetical protein
VQASLNGQQGAKLRLTMKRRCPEILADASAYDGDLVQLCRLSAKLR